MTFTKSDLVTFAIGLAVAVALVLAESLAKLDSQPVADWGIWARNLLPAMGAAAGRYLLTRIPELMTRRRL